MRYQIRLGCQPGSLHRLRAQWVQRLIRRLGHGCDLVPQPDPMVGLLSGHCDVCVMPGDELVRLPNEPHLTVAAWLPRPDTRIAYCAVRSGLLTNPTFPAAVATWSEVVGAQWVAAHPSHRIVLQDDGTVANLPQLDAWLIPADQLRLQGLLADATAFPDVVPPPLFHAYALIVRKDRHSLCDVLALLNDATTREQAQLHLALIQHLPDAYRRNLAVEQRHNSLLVLLSTPEGLVAREAPARFDAVPSLVQSLLETGG